MGENIKIGISSCLLGEKVRYDGGHKLDQFLIERLGRQVKFISICPEVECGFGVPREATRLEGAPASPRMVTIETRTDRTARIVVWSQQKMKQLEEADISGFVFKSKSPSCGKARVKVFGAPGTPRKEGIGLFARVFMDHFPHLPVADETELHDLLVLKSFIERTMGLRSSTR